MNSTTEPIRTPAEPGQRAVGFRAPVKRPPDPRQPAAAEPRVEKRDTASGQTEPMSRRNAPPQSTRRRGRGVLGLLVISVFVGAAWLVWCSFLQFQSYGVIDGRLISVAAPWDGTMTNWQVRDGDLVEQGDIVALMSNLPMHHELEALGDELKMSQAQLDAEMSRVRFEMQNLNQRNQKATAEFLQASGNLSAEESKFGELEKKLERAERLLKSKNTSRARYEKLYFEFTGQKRKIAKLADAVDVLRARSERQSEPGLSGTSQLKPILAQIELTQAKIVRLRERINQGQIKAPVSGRITRRLCLTGEAVNENDTVLEILEDNSIEAVLYVPQRLTDEFQVGETIEIVLEPYQYPMQCTVRRIGDQFEPAPGCIARYYKDRQYLLPVYLTPNPEFKQLMAMRIHGTVKRPYTWKKSLAELASDLQQQFSIQQQNHPSVD